MTNHSSVAMDIEECVFISSAVSNVILHLWVCGVCVYMCVSMCVCVHVCVSVCSVGCVCVCVCVHVCVG